nr:hypothetical protein [Tanacetum cinerariifolium]
PVVVASTNSTNFSGTKDAARQDEKKDVSSLRYIALPNWIHEVHLESSLSQPQDACNTDEPETSPTPTLRIHKHHPKSHKIGYVDTPTQTRNKSKEVGEQSFIATIHQKTDPALL